MNNGGSDGENLGGREGWKTGDLDRAKNLDFTATVTFFLFVILFC